MVRVLKHMNLVFFVIMIGVNIIANVMPLGHGKTGVISEKYPNMFTPAPITFSIWGIIYILVGFFITYQCCFLDSNLFTGIFINQIGYWFIISCIMNIGWLFSWHYERIGLSMIFMVGLLCSLIIITKRLLPIEISHITGSSIIPFFAKISTYGFDIYLGWIVAATIANMSVLLVKLNWNRFGMSEELTTIIVLVLGIMLAVLMVAVSKRYFAALAIAWAYGGILIRHVSQKGYAGKYPLVAIYAGVGVAAIIVSCVVKFAISNRFIDRYF